jgi:hypothetical protein
MEKGGVSSVRPVLSIAIQQPMARDVESLHVVATHGDTTDLQRHFLGSKHGLRVDRYKRYQQCVLPYALGLNVERLVVKPKLSTVALPLCPTERLGAGILEGQSFHWPCHFVIAVWRAKEPESVA